MKKLLVLTLLAGAFLFSGCGSDKSTQVPIPTDNAPPLAPTGLRCQIDDSLVPVLTWDPNTEPDLAGYRVYLYDPDPRRSGSYVLQNPDELLTEEAWTSPPIQYDQVLWVRLTAVDMGGNESSANGPDRVTWQPAPPPPPAPTPTPKPPPQIENPNDASGGGPGGGTPTPPPEGPGGGHGDATDGSGTGGNG
jgi:hypothetical protein